MEQPGTYEILEPIVSGSLRGRHDTSVVTRMSFPAGPAEIWERLMYYEQILKRAPMLLRFLLPTPIRAEGSKSKVGCESRCHYTDGYLLKRATRIVRKQCLQFEIVEQQLMIGNGITVLGGAYLLRKLPNGGTEVALETRYRSPNAPRWLWRRLETIVCHQFHRHILSAMRGDSAPS